MTLNITNSTQLNSTKSSEYTRTQAHVTQLTLAKDLSPLPSSPPQKLGGSTVIETIESPYKKLNKESRLPLENGLFAVSRTENWHIKRKKNTSSLSTWLQTPFRFTSVSDWMKVTGLALFSISIGTMFTKLLMKESLFIKQPNHNPLNYGNKNANAHRSLSLEKQFLKPLLALASSFFLPSTVATQIKDNDYKAWTTRAKQVFEAMNYEGLILSLYTRCQLTPSKQDQKEHKAFIIGEMAKYIHYIENSDITLENPEEITATLEAWTLYRFTNHLQINQQQKGLSTFCEYSQSSSPINSLCSTVGHYKLDYEPLIEILIKANQNFLNKSPQKTLDVKAYGNPSPKQSQETPKIKLINTPLIHSLFNENSLAAKAMVNLLLKYNLSLDKTESPGGNTALSVAALMGNHEVAIYLIKKGAKLNVKNNMGSNIVHQACQSGNHRLISYMKKHHLNTLKQLLQEKNKQGNSPTDLLTENRQKTKNHFATISMTRKDFIDQVMEGKKKIADIISKMEKTEL